jgi:pimeloyl-ACP methyl ester carboxylesterase
MNAAAPPFASNTPSPKPYTPRCPPQAWQQPVRGLMLRGLRWNTNPAQSASTTNASPDDAGTPHAPPLVMVHGWADVGASFQFLVDALAAVDPTPRTVIAPDWRGFGRSDNSGSDAYWFADYLGDLDGLLDALLPDTAVDLLGHSMGGNVVMSYAGARAGRIRRLVNLEGFGLPRSDAAQAPQRLAQWLDELRTPQQFKPFASLGEVSARLQRNNPRLPPALADWLAPHWAEQRDDSLWHVRCDPAHKRVNPQLYQVDDTLACWAAIRAPLLWVEGALSQPEQWWGTRYTRAEFHERLNVVPQVQRVVLPGCGHMLHHDDAPALATRLAAFLNEAPSPQPPAG